MFIEVNVLGYDNTEKSILLPLRRIVSIESKGNNTLIKFEGEQGIELVQVKERVADIVCGLDAKGLYLKTGRLSNTTKQ